MSINRIILFQKIKKLKKIKKIKIKLKLEIKNTFIMTKR